jgi:hypothetical protein
MTYSIVLSAACHLSLLNEIPVCLDRYLLTQLQSDHVCRWIIGTGKNFSSAPRLIEKILPEMVSSYSLSTSFAYISVVISFFSSTLQKHLSGSVLGAE